MINESGIHIGDALQRDMQWAAMAQIATLEAGQARAMREALLGVAGGIEMLAETNARIVALRDARSSR